MLTAAESRAFQQITNHAGRLAVVAADQRASFDAALSAAGCETTLAAKQRIKRDLVEILAPDASAVLLDPEIALPFVVEAGVVPRDTGILVSLETSLATTHGPGHGGERRAQLLPDFGPAGVRRVGGTAAKLLVYLRPDFEDADGANAGVIREAAAACAAADLLLVVEVLTYRRDGEDQSAYDARKPQLIRESALLAEECGARLLKLAIPGDTAACAALTSALKTPWAVLSAGADHEAFVVQLRHALAGGAAGFIAGRSLWKESITLPAEERRTFLHGVGRRRLGELLATLDAS